MKTIQNGEVPYYQRDRRYYAAKYLKIFMECRKTQGTEEAIYRYRKRYERALELEGNPDE